MDKLKLAPTAADSAAADRSEAEGSAPKTAAATGTAKGGEGWF